MRTGGAANYRQRGTGRVATVTAVALPDGRRVTLASACEHQRHRGMRVAPLSLLYRDQERACEPTSRLRQESSE